MVTFFRHWTMPPSLQPLHGHYLRPRRDTNATCGSKAVLGSSIRGGSAQTTPPEEPQFPLAPPLPALDHGRSRMTVLQTETGVADHPSNDDTPRATASLPGLEIEIVHRRPRNAEAEALSITLQAMPSFEAFGRSLEAANPLAFWAQAVQMAWLPWLGTTWFEASR